MLPTDPEPDPVSGADSDADSDADKRTGAGLYIHVPFCTSVCPYCDFAVTIAGEARRQEWVDGIAAEADRSRHLDLEFDTIYLGGGTPSALATEQLTEVLRGLRSRLRVADDAWLHLEANPEHVTRESISVWRALGVRFLSLGLQSFDDATLSFLGRAHSSSVARAAVEAAVDGGFHTVSLDLIYGVPGATRKAWTAELEAATALGIDHLSCYQLTFHEHTVFGKRLRAGRIDELPESVQAELFFTTFETLTAAGFAAYEVSNFAARAEHRSRHNLKYWSGAPYLGLGPSAHSFVAGRRWWNLRKLRQWHSALASGRSPVEGEETPSVEQRVLEALVLGFRTTDGVDFHALDERFGLDLLPANAGVIERLSRSGHVESSGGRVRPTVAGLAIADSLARAIEVPG